MRLFPEHCDVSSAGAKCQTWLMVIAFSTGVSGRAEHSDKEHSSHLNTGCHRDSSGLFTSCQAPTQPSAAWGEAGMNNSKKICGSDEGKKQRQRQATVRLLLGWGCGTSRTISVTAPSLFLPITDPRVAELVRLEGTAVGHLVQPSCLSRVILEHIAQDCVHLN